ncbi:MAG TPA: hypothetical protein VHD57_15115 [Vicinamibacterales bacterium]|nr:hypothetical protein [Vicinamibacterales bacterium]
MTRLLLVPLVLGCAAMIQPPPTADLSNGVIDATVYLPDAARGFYRSTRFDWSGMIGRLDHAGHHYYGPWFTKRDDRVRDFVYDGADIVVSAQSGAVGPAEEFQRPLGYETAPAGGTFVKVGVGVLRKFDAAAYSPFRPYDIVDAGQWSSTTTANSVTSTQRLKDAMSGVGYVYEKTIRLTPGRAEMVITHRLRNTGHAVIDTNVYDHNFLVLDHAVPAPGLTIRLPFTIETPQAPAPALAEIDGSAIVFKKRLEGEERVSMSIRGFGETAADYDIRIEPPARDAAMRIRGDRPLSGLSLWSIRSNVSIEPFLDIHVEPGATFTWTYTYTWSDETRP